jgi:hypothetical protein
MDIDGTFIRSTPEIVRNSHPAWGKVEDAILGDLEEYSNNVIFLCDCDKGSERELFEKSVVQFLTERLKAKLVSDKNKSANAMNIWRPNHIDLFYGAKSFVKNHYESNWCTLEIAASRT